MEEDRKIPFADILSSLFAEELGPIHQLYRLSDMTDTQQAQFSNQWRTVSDIRRQKIVRHLADISESNFVVDFSPIFRSSLRDPYAPVRIAALDGLWDSTDSTLIDPILELLANDPETEVRAAAARSLAHFLMMSEWDQIRGVDSLLIFNTLLDIYRHPESPILLKCAVLEAMGPSPLPETIELIEDAFEGDVFELQLSAVFAMGTSADSRWLSLLLDEMENPREDMRAEAARAVGIIGHSGAIPQLSELALDEDQEVANAAVISLAQIGGNEANRILDELLMDQNFAHLHEIIEEALEESSWVDGELPMFPWSDDDQEDNLKSFNLN